MTRKLTVLLALLVLVVVAVQGRAQRRGEPAAAAPLPEAIIRLEQNATDHDVEVVFEAMGRTDGLNKLTIAAPDGRTVADFKAPDGTTLGMRQFRFESPEPADVTKLKAAYPEGVYTFTAGTAAGEMLSGTATLKHKLPTPTAITAPKADAENVPIQRGLEITWKAVPDAVAYTIELAQEKSDVNLTARLPKSATRFAVPTGFLQPGAEYQLGVGTISAEGNVSVVEINFTVAGGR